MGTYGVGTYGSGIYGDALGVVAERGSMFRTVLRDFHCVTREGLMGTLLDTAPNSFVLGSQEVRELTIETSPSIDASNGDRLLTVTSSLLNLTTGLPYGGVLIPPTFTGTIIKQVLQNVAAGNRYRLTIVFSLNTNKTLEAVLEIWVPV